MTPEENNTWRSIQQKDGQAFERYYKEHYTFFFLTACKYLGDAVPAEEAVNDVFLKLWQEADRIELRSSLKSYLYRAVVNRCLNLLDKHQRERRRQATGYRPEETEESKAMEDQELQLRLYKAIDELPEQCRKVFCMSRFEELKQQEIADRLHISIKTVKNHITQALRQLSRVLDEWNSPLLWAGAIPLFLALQH
ncbi:MAG TPA: RNA polymerase sigma-70 factor [Dinghuibacter sp.]|uniref:RNA polymerase sigma-70 factor n=1 Tax=Dinghuibacter sp. TaxID=2024697 RepID=UPI002BB9606B|nr:RNA polymerase sigma-70 factor [Dinghuibacter sp.]HTJ11807.1 RNA polymerase sigma-70 factor [Dinghuibacter sp.]